MILDGEIGPGSKLTEAWLSERLGVSRGPIREAFRMLEESGLVRQEKNRGVFVRDIPLEEALENFAGCAVVISHDRFFLDRLATHILAFEGNSHVEWFEGNFAAYEEDKRRRLGDAADRPTALAYKKLTR